MYRFTGKRQTRPAGPFSDLPEGSLKVLQLTDSHLYADPSQCLLGLNTLETFDQVTCQAQQTLGQPDLVLATGDLVHDASDSGYKRLRERLRRIGAPAYCLPGNHDLPNKMKLLLNQDGIHSIPSIQQNDWSLIFLDSTIAGQTHGRLSASQLQLLERQLQQHTDKHTLVCLHHHPVPIGSQWMDNIGLEDAEPFLQMVDAHSQVKGVLCGHIHQQFEETRGQVKLMGTPSTCIQFVSGQDEFGIDACPPGYRWLALLPDGEIQSGVELLPQIPVGLDLASIGY